MADYSMDDGLDYDEPEEQPEPQPAAIVEPVAPTPPAAPVETVKSIREKIDAIRANEKLSGERKGEALLPLYKKLTEADKAERDAEAQAPDPQVAQQEAQEITSELRNKWGAQYDERMNGNGRIIVDALGEKAVERFTAIEKNLAFDKSERIAFSLSLADLAAEGEGTEQPEAALSGAEDRLQGFWGERSADEFAFMQRGATHVFGSLEAAEKFVDRKWSGNALAQTRFALLMNKIGRRMKG